MNKAHLLVLLSVVFSITACSTRNSEQPQAQTPQELSINMQKQAILKTLNDETKAAFQRDYDAWQSQWVHSPTMTKVYEDLAGGESSTSTGWEEISQFVKDFFAAHPGKHF